jgi:hypothetical protein
MDNFKNQGSRPSNKGQDKPSYKSQPSNARPQGKKTANFAAMAALLPKVLRKLGMDNRLKEHTFMSLWPHVVGEPFGRLARPLFIDSQKNLVVAVRDASVGQEISFVKGKLLVKLRHAAVGLGLEISGMRFDLKHFHDKPLEEYAEFHLPVALPEPAEETLRNWPLCSEDQRELANMAARLEVNSQIPALGATVQAEDKAQAQEAEHAARLNRRIYLLFEKELRLKRWREAQGFPRCSQCGEVSSRLYGREAICSLCFAKEAADNRIERFSQL